MSVKFEREFNLGPRVTRCLWLHQNTHSRTVSNLICKTASRGNFLRVYSWSAVVVSLSQGASQMSPSQMSPYSIYSAKLLNRAYRAPVQKQCTQPQSPVGKIHSLSMGNHDSSWLRTRSWEREYPFSKSSISVMGYNQ